MSTESRNYSMIESSLDDETITMKAEVQVNLPVSMWVDHDQTRIEEVYLKFQRAEGSSSYRKRKLDEINEDGEDREAPLSSQASKKVNIGPQTNKYSNSSSQKGNSQNKRLYPEQTHRTSINKLSNSESNYHHLLESQPQLPNIAIQNLDQLLHFFRIMGVDFSKIKERVEEEKQISRERNVSEKKDDKKKEKKNSENKKKKSQKINQPEKKEERTEETSKKDRKEEDIMPLDYEIYNQGFDIDSDDTLQTYISIQNAKFLISKRNDIKKIDQAYKMRFKGCDKKIDKGYSMEISGKAVISLEDDWKKIRYLFRARRYNYLRTSCYDKIFYIKPNPNLDDNEFDLYIRGEKNDPKKSRSEPQSKIKAKEDSEATSNAQNPKPADKKNDGKESRSESEIRSSTKESEKNKKMNLQNSSFKKNDELKSATTHSKLSNQKPRSTPKQTFIDEDNDSYKIPKLSERKEVEKPISFENKERSIEKTSFTSGNINSNNKATGTKQNQSQVSRSKIQNSEFSTSLNDLEDGEIPNPRYMSKKH